jgi:S1-C subfamily serine protease
MMYRFMPTLLLMMWFSVSSQAQVDQSKDQQGTHEKLPIPLQAPEPTPSALPTSREEIKLSYAKLVKDVAPAVVNIFASSVTKTQTNSPLYEDPFFKQFFGEDFFSDSSPMRIQRSLGSGVIVRNDGIIITSYHVNQSRLIRWSRARGRSGGQRTQNRPGCLKAQKSTGKSPLP